MTAGDLLSLPTDSLYKFLALSGLLIFGVAAILPFYAMKAFRFEVFQLRMEHDIRRTRFDDLKRRHEAAEASPDYQKPEVQDQYHRELIEFLCLNHEMECKIKQAEYLHRQIRLISGAQIVGLITGSVMAASGFYLWYVKIQVYLDAALKAHVL